MIQNTLVWEFPYTWEKEVIWTSKKTIMTPVYDVVSRTEKKTHIF